MAKVASRAFKDPSNAEAAIKELVSQGFKAEDIGVKDWSGRESGAQYVTDDTADTGGGATVRLDG